MADEDSPGRNYVYFERMVSIKEPLSSINGGIAVELRVSRPLEDLVLACSMSSYCSLDCGYPSGGGWGLWFRRKMLTLFVGLITCTKRILPDSLSIVHLTKVFGAKGGRS